MYPVIRLTKEYLKFRHAPLLALEEAHVSHHRCWPWDLDFMLELNNGRTLTLYDLGRILMARRLGLLDTLRRNRWAITVAGNTMRYRRRVRIFDRLEMHSRCVGWDARFFYITQSMWRGDECTSHMLLRSAITDADGIVPTARVIEAMGASRESPELPHWVEAWISAEAERPWPPER